MNKDQNSKEQCELKTKKRELPGGRKNQGGNGRLGNTSHRIKEEYGK